MNKHLPKWLWAIITIAGILGIGVLDGLTGYELNFFVFYFLPVSVGAWFLGLGGAIISAVLSALVWFGADFISGHTHTSHFVAVWNTMVRLISFLSIGWTVSKMRTAIDREHDNAEKLSRVLSEVKVLETFLPICAKCKKIRNEQGEWQNVEVYIAQHSNTQFSHGYCSECFKKEIEELRLSFDENQNHDQYH